MVVTEITESEKVQIEFNRQLDVLDLHAVQELVSGLHEARSYGYEYVDIAQLERGLLAVAALQGATDILSAEDALLYLADKATSDTDRITSLEESNNELAEKLEKSGTEIEKLEKRPAAEPVERFILTKDQMDGTSGVLFEANEILVKVPGQRSLAQQAIHAARTLAELESTMVVIVEDDEL